MIGFMQLSAAMLGLSSPLYPQIRFPNGPTPNKYTPHQGKRECARRVRQMKRDAANRYSRSMARVFAMVEGEWVPVADLVKHTGPVIAESEGGHAD